MRNSMSGQLVLENSSRDIRTEAALTWQEALLLTGLGAAAVVLHSVFRFPLQLPGHHGVEWMALIIGGRLAVRYRMRQGTVCRAARFGRHSSRPELC